MMFQISDKPPYYASLDNGSSDFDGHAYSKSY